MRELYSATAAGPASYLAAVNRETGNQIAQTIVDFMQPLLVVGVIAIAAYFAFQKQFSKVWTVIIIGAVVFALTLNIGGESIVKQIADFFVDLLGPATA